MIQACCSDDEKHGNRHATLACTHTLNRCSLDGLRATGENDRVCGLRHAARGMSVYGPWSTRSIRSFVRAYSHTPAVGGGCMCPKRAAGTVTSLVVEWLLARRWDTGSRDLIYITYTHSTLPDDLPPRSHRRDNEARMTATPAWTRDAVRDYC